MEVSGRLPLLASYYYRLRAFHSMTARDLEAVRTHLDGRTGSKSNGHRGNSLAHRDDAHQVTVAVPAPAAPSKGYMSLSISGVRESKSGGFPRGQMPPDQWWVYPSSTRPTYTGAEARLVMQPPTGAGTSTVRFSPRDPTRWEGGRRSDRHGTETRARSRSRSRSRSQSPRESGSRHHSHRSSLNSTRSQRSRNLRHHKLQHKQPTAPPPVPWPAALWRRAHSSHGPRSRSTPVAAADTHDHDTTDSHRIHSGSIDTGRLMRVGLADHASIGRHDYHVDPLASQGIMHGYDRRATDPQTTQVSSGVLLEQGIQEAGGHRFGSRSEIGSWSGKAVDDDKAINARGGDDDTLRLPNLGNTRGAGSHGMGVGDAETGFGSRSLNGKSQQQ